MASNKNYHGDWPDVEAWKNYGLERGYAETNPSSLYLSQDSEERAWYRKGNSQKWLAAFNFKKKRPAPIFTTFKQWRQYGLEKGYNHRNAVSLDENPEGKHWYSRGSVKGWLQKFKFKRKFENSGLVFRNVDEWKRHGVEQNYAGRTPSSLSLSQDIKERAWYQKGQRNEWLDEFNFERKGEAFNSLKNWKNYGIERGYDARNSKSIAKSEDSSERSWYIKGAQQKWLRSFKFKGIEKGVKPEFEDFTAWQQEGIRREYHQRNSMSLAKSKKKDERSWYGRGARMKWLRKFDFDRKIDNTERSNLRFETYDEWSKYGLNRKYNGRIPSNLVKSGDIKDRAWYAKGNSAGWLKQFPFKNRRPRSGLEFGDMASWKEYGIKAGFDKRNPTSMGTSKDITERAWYRIGCGYGWNKQFDFKVKKRNSLWKDEEEWRKWGIEQGFEKTNPASLIKSSNEIHSFWYDKGQREGWVKTFKFTRKTEKSPYATFEEWRDYGLRHGFDKRNSSSLIESDIKSERSWYSTGGNNKWITRFSFSRLEEKVRKVEEEALGSLLELYAGED